MNRKHLLLIGALTLLLGLIAYAPAATLYRWIAPKNDVSGVEYYGIQGTLSQGQVAAISVRGRTVLSDLHWTFKPLWLLLAQRVFTISGGSEQATLEARLRLTPTGALVIGNLHTSLHLKDLLSAAGQTYLPLDGQIVLDIDSLKFKNSQLQKVTGTAQIRGLAWTLAKEPLSIGDFEAKASTTDGAIQILLKSISGPLEVKGEIKIASDQIYRVTLQYRAKAQADPMLRNLVSSAGAPDAQGWTHYNSQGRLVP